MSSSTPSDPKIALQHDDGIVATAAEQARISQTVAATFAGPAGEETLKWLERITVRRVITAYDKENHRPVTDAELWQQEGMRKLLALIKSRIDHAHSTQTAKKGKSNVRRTAKQRA